MSWDILKGGLGCSIASSNLIRNLNFENEPQRPEASKTLEKPTT
jgi:hypothetical protein